MSPKLAPIAVIGASKPTSRLTSRNPLLAEISVELRMAGILSLQAEMIGDDFGAGGGIVVDEQVEPAVVVKIPEPARKRLTVAGTDEPEFWGDVFEGTVCLRCDRAGSCHRKPRRTGRAARRRHSRPRRIPWRPARSTMPADSATFLNLPLPSLW